jgi:hypothetical protein
MVVKPIEQTALSLLTNSFVDSSIVIPAVLGIGIASAGIYGIYLLYNRFKTSTDSSNDGSNSDSLMEPVVDTVENLTSPDFVDLEFQKLEHICSNNSLFDFLYMKSYFMDVLNSIPDFNVSVCLGFCFLQKILPYARTILPDRTSITKTFNSLLIYPSKAFIVWCFPNIAERISVSTTEQLSADTPTFDTLTNPDVNIPKLHFALSIISLPSTTVNDAMFDFLVYLENYSPVVVDVWFSFLKSREVDLNENSNFFDDLMLWERTILEIERLHSELRRMQQQQTDLIDDRCDARLLYRNVLNLKLMHVDFFSPAIGEILSEEESVFVIMKTGQLRFIHHCLKIKDEYHLHLFLNTFYYEKLKGDDLEFLKRTLDEEGNTLLTKFLNQSERRDIGFTIYPKSD